MKRSHLPNKEWCNGYTLTKKKEACQVCRVHPDHCAVKTTSEELSVYYVRGGTKSRGVNVHPSRRMYYNLSAVRVIKCKTKRAWASLLYGLMHERERKWPSSLCFLAATPLQRTSEAPVSSVKLCREQMKLMELVFRGVFLPTGCFSPLKLQHKWISDGPLDQHTHTHRLCFHKHPWSHKLSANTAPCHVAPPTPTHNASSC